MYKKRDQLLLLLGYSSYSDYLDSPLWRSIRRRVMERDNRKCKLCGQSAGQVHHKEYARKAGALSAIKKTGRDVRGFTKKVKKQFRRIKKRISVMESDRRYHEKMCGR